MVNSKINLFCRPLSLPLQCCNLLLVETLKDPLCFKVSDQTIPKQQHVVQVSYITLHYITQRYATNHLQTAAHVPDMFKYAAKHTKTEPDFF